MKIKYNLWNSRIKKNWQLYLFLLLPITYIVIFSYVPMLGLQIAFRDFKAGTGIWRSTWVGIKHFDAFFHNFYFWRMLRNTLLLSAYAITFSFPFPIITALLMNVLRSNYMRKVTQTIMTLPHFISIVVLVGMLNQFLNSRYGIYGNIVLRITGDYPRDIFSNPSCFRPIYVWSGIWQNFGWNSIIYLAALQGVSPALHEAATIDGASRFKRVIHIDIPSILPTIVIMLIMRTGSVMEIGFEKVYLLQNNLNLETSEVISTYVYKTGLSASGNTDFSSATAIGMFNSITNLLLISIVNKIADKLSGNSMW